MSTKEETKMMYELAKIANTSRQLSDDFIQTVSLFMFRDYLNSLPNGEEFLHDFMSQWEQDAIDQKTDELEVLAGQQGSMMDMAAGAIIANSENLETYKEDVSIMKDLFIMTLLGE